MKYLEEMKRHENKGETIVILRENGAPVPNVIDKTTNCGIDSYRRYFSKAAYALLFLIFKRRRKSTSGTMMKPMKIIIRSRLWSPL